MSKHNPKKHQECAEFERVLDEQLDMLVDDLQEAELKILRLEAEVAGLRLALAAARPYPAQSYPVQPYPGRIYPAIPAAPYTVTYGSGTTSSTPLRSIS